jgi:hypothetical protein
MTDLTFDCRKYRRVSSDSLVSLGRMDTGSALAHAVDLSIGGIRFTAVGMEVAEGEILRVRLTLGERTATLVGQVRRAVKLDEYAQELGLVFTKMDPETQALLAENLPELGEWDSEGDERRGQPRAMFEGVLSVSRASLFDVAAQARDLSVGGLRFEVEGLDLELAETLQVVLNLDGYEARVIGQLVRVTEIDGDRQEVALAFFDVDPETLERLEEQLPDDG